ncbi:13270_t:CDS:2 [Gigaspora rosea]|nr:13270_t:CDS:2 [Gigaspora rosea]
MMKIFHQIINRSETGQPVAGLSWNSLRVMKLNHEKRFLQSIGAEYQMKTIVMEPSGFLYKYEIPALLSHVRPCIVITIASPQCHRANCAY